MSINIKNIFMVLIILFIIACVVFVTFYVAKYNWILAIIFVIGITVVFGISVGWHILDNL
jgi:predicted membrane channel-forming protein YqfA (hemolysin III family)